MKVKFLWIMYLPVILLSVIIKGLELFGFNIYFDRLSTDYVLVAAVSIFVIISAILSYFDKKTSQVYLLKTNKPAFVFALLSAIFISSKSFLNLFNELMTGEYDTLVLVTSFVGVLASASLIVMSLAHLIGKNHLPNTGAFFVLIPIWFVLSVMRCFMEGRIVSAVDIDPIRMFFYIFGSILFLNIPMAISLIKGKKPITSILVYGIPFILLGLVFFFNTVRYIIVNRFDFSQNISGFIGLSTGLYAFFVLLEVIKYTSKADKNEYAFDLDNVSVEKPLYGITSDELVVANSTNEGVNSDEYTVSPEVAGDFITEVYNDDYIPSEEEQSQVDDMIYATEETDDNDDAIYIPKNMAEVFKNKITSSDEDNQDNIEKPINDISNS